MEISKDSKFTLSLESMVTIGFALVSVVALYFALQKEIELAKQLPEPVVSRTEYELKDELVRTAIMDTQKQVEQIGSDVKKIDERLYQLTAK